MEEERTKILHMIESGKISAEAGLALLDVLEAGGQAAPPPQAPPGFAVPWRQAWLYVVYAGVGVLTLAALLLYAMWAGGSPWWGVCGWPLLALGVLLTTLGACSRTARWLHVRVTGRDHRVAISLPLPLRLAAWGVRIARRFVPYFEESGLDEVIMSLQDDTGQGQPFYVDVTDDDSGEHVQVYVG